MAQIAKLEAQVDVKSSAETFYQTFLRKQHFLPQISPNVALEEHLTNGHWDSVGSIRQYAYASPGNSSSKQVDTVRVEAIDEENKSICSKLLDGEAMKHYKSIKYTIQVSEKSAVVGAGGGSSVKTTIEYEKRREDVPPPHKYIQFAQLLFSCVDAYLINA